LEFAADDLPMDWSGTSGCDRVFEDDWRNIGFSPAILNERNRLIYKGECQEKYFSLDRKWRNFS